MRTKLENDCIRKLLIKPSDQYLSLAKINWFSRPKREDPDPKRRIVLNGVSRSDIETGTHTIVLNTHADSSFSNVARSNDTAHHEKIHDLGFQLGYKYARGEIDLLGEQAHDGMLWCYLRQEDAVISARIRPAYKAQFHEVVAFDDGNKMAAAVTEMLKPGFKPEISQP